MDIAFRPATTDDAAPLAAFAERVFRATFGPHNTAADMDSYCAGAFGADRQHRELADADRHTELVTVQGQAGELAGYVQLRSAPPPACVTGAAPIDERSESGGGDPAGSAGGAGGKAPREIEILRFYVDHRWHGRGVAQALMNHTLDLARRRGARTLYLSVWDRNQRAIAFYARYGFARVGTKQFVLGSDVQIDNVMARAL